MRNGANQKLDSVLDIVPTEYRTLLKEKIEGAINYTPKIGIMGKSGAGKSSLANVIIGDYKFKTGGAGGCTRTIQEEKVRVGSRDIIFIDLPGIAENEERHIEYSELYAKKLPDLDVLLWVIKIDDRANAADEAFYQFLIKHYDKNRILFVLSQADKAHPNRQWDYSRMQPSEKQLVTIEANKQRISDDFSVPLEDVVAVASICDEEENKLESYKFDELITKIITKIPNEAKSSFISSVDKDLVTKEAKTMAQDGFGELVSKAVDVLIDYVPAPAVVKTALRAGKDLVVSGVKEVWDWFFG